MSELALLGGPKAVPAYDEEMFHWPRVTPEMEEAVLAVLRSGDMSGIGITREFEKKFAAWMGVKYALASPNGTGALQEAMFAVGVGMNCELICPSLTYWASCLPAVGLGARVVFADVEPDTLCLDPASFEAHITPRTKAVVVVHYLGHPADMDPIMEIAKRHGIKVIEDVSHAQGGWYKGRRLGTMGDVGACSMMSGKSFSIGEGGMLYTNSKAVYEKALTFGHYERIGEIKDLKLPEGAGKLPWGGCKHRINQIASAMGLCQLGKYEREIAEIDRAMKYFWNGIRDIEGLRMHYPEKWENSTKAGWYEAKLFYDAQAFGGLSLTRFAEALRAEGVRDIACGCNTPLHHSTLFSRIDIYGGLGRPTANLFDPSDAAVPPGALPAAEAANDRLLGVPSFRRFRPEELDLYIAAYRKVAAHYGDLLTGDRKEKAEGIFYHF
ncbi:MAG: DegT/DnrJ/EryC1/StrS family aminotransferase [Lentisphaeria bacterium]|nr:DegT/DnrJ/EryC1/StrS family aminotransferase [Lentisphaeria bacterium]